MKSVMKSLNSAIFAGVLIAVLGCSQKPDFAYKVVDQPSTGGNAPPVKIIPRTEIDHKIKELTGFGSADILWVIDNSGSMAEYQQAVMDNMDSFMKEFLTFNVKSWKMGILSTDVAEDPYLGFDAGDELNEKTPNAVDVFNEAVSHLGTNGDSTEKTFDPIKKYLNKYKNFTRPDAGLFIIMISDAKEQSTISATNFLTYLLNLKGNLNKVVTFGVLADAENGCDGSISGEESFDFTGSKYDVVMKQTRGTNFLICSDDYGKNLALMAKAIGNSVERPKLVLKTNPVPESIVVTYKGVVLPPGDKEDGGYWFYDFMTNSVWFHNMSVFTDVNEEIHVSYVDLENAR